MNENSYPLAVLYGYKSGRDEISFVGRNGIVCLTGNSWNIDQILRRCNGITSIRDISLQIRSLNIQETLELASLLEQQGIIRESRELYLSFHEDSANPASFIHDLGDKEVSFIASQPRLRRRDGEIVKLSNPPKSKLLDIISKRHSIRRFTRKSISSCHVHGLLKAVYGVNDSGHWSVASGGALYPLDIYLIIISNSPLSHGIYRWWPETGELLIVSHYDPNVWINKAFNAKDLLKNSSCIICVACDFRRSAMKYANRGYRNVLLEAGHSVQNVYLYGAEHDIGVVEYVGFNERTLAESLGLNFPNESVLSTLVIGHADKNASQSSTNDQKTDEIARELRLKLVGDNKPIEKIVFWDPDVLGYRMPKWIAMASYHPPHSRASISMRKRCSAFATGFTSSEATIKCLAEGYERYAWDNYRSDIIESAKDLQELYLDPHEFVHYSPEQYKRLKDITPFSEKEKIGWVSGVKLNSNEHIWVPAELVFNPPRIPKGRSQFCFRANSNGIAAHFDRDLAIDSALYELIERDAFCVHWYSKTPPRILSESILPTQILDRMQPWNKNGYSISVMDITIDGPPIVLVVIWSSHLTPSIMSGAGCRPNFFDALDKAFDEAEFMAVTWHGRKLQQNMSTRDIHSPDDHGVYYSDPSHFKHLSWMFKSNTCIRLAKDQELDREKLDPIMVDITPKDYPCGLVVVKTFSSHLMPIGFGYGQEHYGHRRLEMLGLSWKDKYPSRPHFFA